MTNEQLAQLMVDAGANITGQASPRTKAEVLREFADEPQVAKFFHEFARLATAEVVAEYERRIEDLESNW